MSEQQSKRQMADTLEKYFSERLLGPLAEREKEAQTNKEFYLSSKEFVYYSTVTGHEPPKQIDTQGQCHYCGVIITEKNYKLREVRTVNELGDYEPCCDDCAEATSIKPEVASSENTNCGYDFN